jgi:hypothetical protein
LYFRRHCRRIDEVSNCCLGREYDHYLFGSLWTFVASDLVQRALLFELDGDPSDAILGGTCSLKIEFRFLNGNLIVPGGPSAYLLVDDQRQPIKPLEVLMNVILVLWPLRLCWSARWRLRRMPWPLDMVAADAGAATWAVGSAGHC